MQVSSNIQNGAIGSSANITSASANIVKASSNMQAAALSASENLSTGAMIAAQNLGRACFNASENAVVASANVQGGMIDASASFAKTTDGLTAYALADASTKISKAPEKVVVVLQWICFALVFSVILALSMSPLYKVVSFLLCWSFGRRQ